MNTTSNPTGTNKSFYHQAAQFSLYAPIAAFVLGILLNGPLRSSVDPESARTVGVIIGGINILLILAGFIMGIIALFGMNKVGKKGILGRALTGVIVSGIFIFFALLTIPSLMTATAKAKQGQLR